MGAQAFEGAGSAHQAAPRNSPIAVATRSTVPVGMCVCKGSVKISRVAHSVTLRSPRRHDLRYVKF